MKPKIADFQPAVIGAEIVSLLNHAIKMELQAVLQYWHYRNCMVGKLHEELSEMFDEISDQEEEHAQEFAEWIVTFGGLPEYWPLPFKAENLSVNQMLNESLDAESDALKFYEEIRQRAEAINHTGLVLFLEHVMEEEQQHYIKVSKALRGAAVVETVYEQDK